MEVISYLIDNGANCWGKCIKSSYQLENEGLIEFFKNKERG